MYEECLFFTLHKILTSWLSWFLVISFFNFSFHLPKCVQLISAWDSSFLFYFILWPVFSYFDRAFFHCAPLSFCMSSDFQQHLMNYVHNKVAASHSYFWWSDKAVDYKFITSEWALCKTLWTKRNTSMTYLSSKSLYFNFTKKKLFCPSAPEKKSNASNAKNGFVKTAIIVRYYCQESFKIIHWNEHITDI